MEIAVLGSTAEHKVRGAQDGDAVTWLNVSRRRCDDASRCLTQRINCVMLVSLPIERQIPAPDVGSDNLSRVDPLPVNRILDAGRSGNACPVYQHTPDCFHVGSIGSISIAVPKLSDTLCALGMAHCRGDSPRQQIAPASLVYFSHQ